MAPLCCAAKFDPFLSLDCAPTPSTLAKSKERKGSNFAIWQPCYQEANAGSIEPCRCSCGGGDCKYCLTRMMDCRKPSAGFPDNMLDELMVDGVKIVQPCTGDGYTRLDNKCGCNDCYC